MTDREHIERSGPGRRRYPTDDRALKCLWCEDKEEQMKSRWKDHLDDEHERREVCGKMVEKLQRAVEDNVPWRFFYIITLLAIGAVGWLYVDHFGLSKIVATQTGVLQITAENVAEMSKAMGLRPKTIEELKKP